MIGLITCYFNPTNSSTLRSKYIEFRKHLKHPIVTVELAFNDHPFFIEDAIQIRGSEKNFMWQKERLLNIALESLPNEIDKVAWLDADIIFENENWLLEAEKALDDAPVIQLFENAYESTNNHFPVHSGHAFGLNLTQSKLSSLLAIGGVRGMAWGARREVLKDGFFDLGIIGSGDTYQIIAWLNDWSDPHVLQMPPLLRKQFLLWAERAGEKVKGNIGVIQGRVRHIAHGSLKGRDYLNRQGILINHNFCPDTDITMDSNGIWSFSANKPALEQEIKKYFYKRKVDEGG